MRGSLNGDDDGQIIHMHAIVTDVTDEKDLSESDESHSVKKAIPNCSIRIVISKEEEVPWISKSWINCWAKISDLLLLFSQKQYILKYHSILFFCLKILFLIIFL